MADKTISEVTAKSSPIRTITDATATITSADNGKILTNAGATADTVWTFDTLANLGNAFQCQMVNEAGGNGVDSLTKLMLHFNNDAIDSSSSNHAPTASNMTYDNSAGQFKFGYSGVFNGTSACITYPDNGGDLDIGASDITFSAWIKLANKDKDQAIYFQQTAGNSSPIYIAINSSNKLAVGLSQSGSAWYPTTGQLNIGTEVFTTDKWYHIAVIISQGTMRTYVNGVLDQTLYNVGTLYTSNYAVSIGKYIYSGGSINWFDGKIDELKMDIGIARNITMLYPQTMEYFTGHALTLAPPSGGQLPNTSAVDRNLKSSAKNDFLGIRTTDTGFIATGVFPSSANWVDSAP